ncbi:hypothetical protein A9Q76_02785 [Arcobacter sp. 31_11_sub10_T18]|nr:hypothetical protein A9Q76_02785 [Arcobacter sp. 31_11_sub10_T18]
MKDVPNIIISFLFLLVLTLPLTIVLFSTYGGLATLAFLILPLGWFILDSDITHYSMDQYLE